MKSKYMLWMIGVLMLVAGPAAYAQPCTPFPPIFDYVIPVQSSVCFHACVGTYWTLTLEGNLTGPESVPVVILQPGCQTGNCNEPPCPPINPPLELIFGADPFAPNDWYGISDCLEIWMYWDHDNVWAFEIFSSCEGCFCVTFDRQLAVQLSSLTAQPGDNEMTLNWVTASESNSDHFELDRDGAKLDDVPATNQPTGSSYTYTDRTAVNGHVYTYTLVSVDVVGARTELGHISASPSSASATVSDYALHQNYPNPFNPETSISFDLVQDGVTRLTVFNVLGQDVATLVNGPQKAGRHTVMFNASNLPSGLYLCKLQVNGFSDTKKLVLIK